MQCYNLLRQIENSVPVMPASLSQIRDTGHHLYFTRLNGLLSQGVHSMKIQNQSPV